MDLDDVYESVRDDERWDELRQPGIVLVKGRGQTESPLAMLVGEAPGATENLRRAPFVGPSGRVLTQLMALAELYADDDACTGSCGSPHAQYDCPFRTDIRGNAFITNVVKYRPPGNRTPTLQEVVWGREALRLEWMALGRPRLIVAVGAPARAALLGDYPRTIPPPTPGHCVPLRDGRTHVYIQYHPQWGIRQGPRGRATMERQWEGMGKWISSNLT